MPRSRTRPRRKPQARLTQRSRIPARLRGDFKLESFFDRAAYAGFLPVSYGDGDLRRKFDQWLADFAQTMERVGPPDREETWRLALDALNVTAAAWALSTKAPKWADEREVRMVFLVRDGRFVEPTTRVRENGREHRYIVVPVTRLPRMPLEEFIVGANQDVVAGAHRALQLLTETKYRDPARRIVVSAASSLSVV
jgi:hypothetical protein